MEKEKLRSGLILHQTSKGFLIQQWPHKEEYLIMKNILAIFV
jgi:hypothetical protein